VNREQSGTQLFYFINKFHDHLAAKPIGFTEAAGNFQQVNRSGQGKGGDPVQGHNMDGANTANGLPDGFHIDNANMATPPDGIPPRMQMYLFHFPDPAAEDPFLQADGSDEADIVYHEHTHGLSNRLVVDANGISTLGNVQAGAMGEAWSDWYALDFLVGEGFERDTATPGELIVGKYVEAGGQNLIRTQPLDCAVGAPATACPGTPGAGSGGYTYGDFGKIIGQPEVHADGEIWGETLWDLRKAIGQRLAESLVTRAMELSPANPSHLDMRNSILQADKVTNKGKARDKIWKVFAHRGMGFFAAASSGDDTAPIENFDLPPAKNTPRATWSAPSSTPTPSSRSPAPWSRSAATPPASRTTWPRSPTPTALPGAGHLLRHLPQGLRVQARLRRRRGDRHHRRAHHHAELQPAA
jgi:extracellular elastinolytic metalloproteinase